MPRYAKKGSTLEDIYRKMYDMMAKEEDCYYLNEIREAISENLDEIRRWDDIPAEMQEDFVDNFLEYFAFSDTKARKDLEKVNFEPENTFASHEGKKALPYGTAIFWAGAGGDWEFPVEFVLYIDPKGQLRGYIPEDGNIYCHTHKCAYGSCECQINEDDAHVDWDKMYEDVCNRIQTKE